MFNDNFNFSESELNVLQYWKKIDAFQTSLTQSKGKKKFTFYDGPPFATGLPHYGHILAGTIKDTVTRYAHQTGHHVDRRFGWDCHGVPVEHLIDKKLKISGPADVEKFGIAAYNKECRSIVTKYSHEWEETVSRLGRWIDFSNDYKTMYPWFMESVWFVFKEIFAKGMVYQGVKVMPFSVGCSTPLSNFEAKQNFKDVSDPAVTVSFPLESDPTTELLAWTTTPWTLPSNLALCVNAELTYVKIKDEGSGKNYILLESRMKEVLKGRKFSVIDRFLGKELVSLRYIPMFDYFLHMREQTCAFRVLSDAYVTKDAGTGIVHQAPYFGEDDYRVCMANGIIKKDAPMICPVDDCGKFTAEVRDFVGQYVKDADKNIIKYIKERNRLINHATENHSYPFCWRSDQPLIYKAVPSWFIKVENIVDDLLKSNAETYWVPDFVKESRFGNWLKDARDWCISRKRFWGTPIPLWVSDDLEEVVCVGSIEELYQLSGVRVTDLHRETIDNIVIPSKTDRGVLRRIPEVFDCWFESGSMPFAQVHFPFGTSVKQFKEIFPADFIAEGIDQTRGWFYTLTVISTILFGRSPFKNLIVNGIVLASDGQKMSKSKGNYPPPTDVILKYGADAIRLFLINSPVVRAQNLRFDEKGVKDVLKDVFLPWFNAYKFLLVSSVGPYEKRYSTTFLFETDSVPHTTNMMDTWIVSLSQSLVAFIRQQMTDYRLDTVLPRLIKYIDHLTNWYVRMNRKRLRGEVVSSDEDWKTSLHTLFFVLYQMTIIMAPFVPFLTEMFYQELRSRLIFSTTGLKVGIDAEGRPESVHYLMIPEAQEILIQKDIECSIADMQTTVEMGRKIRDQERLPLKSPLTEVIVVAADEARLNRMQVVEQYIREELNVRRMIMSTDKAKYNIQLQVELNHKALGPKLKGDYKAVMSAAAKLTTSDIEQFQKAQSIKIMGHELGADDVQVVISVGDLQQYRSMCSEDGLIVLLDCQQSDDLVQEGLTREVINRIQRTRKERALVPEDPIRIYCWSDSERVRSVFTTHAAMIEQVVVQPIIVSRPDTDELIKCSIVNDAAPTVKEIKDSVGGEYQLNIWMVHDHNRVLPTNRQCSCVDSRSDSKLVKFMCKRLSQFVELDIGKLKDIDEIKRHVRVAFGWTNFPSSRLDIFDETGSSPLLILNGSSDFFVE